MKDIILVCDDLFGLEIYTILAETNRWFKRRGQELPYRLIGYISDIMKPFNRSDYYLPYLGALSSWKPCGQERYVLGIKMPERKKWAVVNLMEKGCLFETVLAPWVLTPRDIPIGEGSVIAAHTIMKGMRIGRFVTVLASFLSESFIGDYSTMLHCCNVIGDIGEETYIGNHVYSCSGKKIGDRCYVSDGSIVVSNVKSGTAVAGVPARKIHC